ncbi:hypothetical protein HLH32_01320 [Gluconacetobacter liquefaciens]|uniref:Uncharacterized protein n=1 Tax=Gluconacetobacter liquefaciens TaxID=89584 RepID=A0A7W4JHX4_GLULI|nr:hypothetical protein [Gluconacetobacter liquefaciens]MBB2185044.1 hypothetical protein [Gluconacetobacter liquefaciens]
MRMMRLPCHLGQDHDEDNEPPRDDRRDPVEIPDQGRQRRRPPQPHIRPAPATGEAPADKTRQQKRERNQPDLFHPRPRRAMERHIAGQQRPRRNRQSHPQPPRQKAERDRQHDQPTGQDNVQPPQFHLPLQAQHVRHVALQTHGIDPSSIIGTQELIRYAYHMTIQKIRSTY